MNGLSCVQDIKVLHFTLQTIRMCIELKYIVKILPLITLSEMPKQAQFIAGLIQLGGINIPVIDLALRIGIDRKPIYTLKTPILLCHHQGRKAGFIVDEIKQIRIVHRAALQTHSEIISDQSPFCAVINDEDGLSFLIDYEKITKITWDDSSGINFPSLLSEMNQYEYEQHDR